MSKRVRPKALPPEIGSVQDYERVLRDALVGYIAELRDFYELPDLNEKGGYGGDYWRVPQYRNAPVLTEAESVEAHYIQFRKQEYMISGERFQLWVRQ